MCSRDIKIPYSLCSVILTLELCCLGNDLNKVLPCVFPTKRYLDKGRSVAFMLPPSQTTDHSSYWIIQDKQWPTLGEQMKEKRKTGFMTTVRKPWQLYERCLLGLLCLGHKDQQAEPSDWRFLPLRGGSLPRSPFPCRELAFVQLQQDGFCFGGLSSPPQTPWLPMEKKKKVLLHSSYEKKNHFKCAKYIYTH